jgi:hypothetical protein
LCITQDGKIIIGVVPESSIELEINEEWISELICLLDGKNNIIDINTALRMDRYPVEDDFFK